MNDIYSVRKLPVHLYGIVSKETVFFLRVEHPLILYKLLGSIRPPTQGIPSLLSQGRNRPPVCHRAPWEAHSFAHSQRFLSRRRRRRKRKQISAKREVMEIGNLRWQALPLFLVLTLLTKEIHGFTLPQASKENKESLTEAMVIHFVTSVSAW